MQNNGIYDDLFKRALTAGKNREYDKAITYLKTIVAETDTLPQALLYLGRSYHAIGAYEKAIRAFKYFIASMPEEAAGYFFIGRTYLTVGQYDRAVIYLKKALTLHQDNALMYGLLGLAYLKKRKPEIALKFLETAIYIAPDNHTLYIGYINTLTVQAIKLFQVGDFDLAGQMFRFVLDNGNKDILPHVYLALIERELGNYRQSLMHYDKAIKLAPDDKLIQLGRASVLLTIGALSEAHAEIDRLGSFFPELKNVQLNSDLMLRFLAIQCFRKQEFRKAIFFAKKILKRFGQDAEMHLLMGEAKRNLGDLEAAKNHFKRVLDTNKKHIEARYGIILVYWIKQQYGAILHELKHIRTIDPDDPYLGYYEVLCRSKLNLQDGMLLDDIIQEIKSSGPDVHLLNTLAVEYLKKEYIDLSEKWFKKALMFDRKNRTALKGLIECALKKGIHDDIVNDFSAYLEVFQNDQETRKEYIHYLIDKEQYAPAIEELQKYQAHFTSDSKLNRLLALCYRKTEQYDDAVIVYRRLLRNEPKNREYLLNLIFCLEKSGKPALALSLLEKAKAFFPSATDIMLVHGSLLFRSQDSERALEIFRKILEFNPNEWRAYRNIGLIYKNKGIGELSEKFMAHAERYKQASKA